MIWIIIIAVAILIIIAAKNILRNAQRQQQVHVSDDGLSVADASKMMAATYNSLYGSLSEQQKLSLLHLVGCFVAYDPADSGKMAQANDIWASFSGMLNISEAKLAQSLQTEKQSDIEKLISEIKPLKGENFMDLFMYTCFSVVSVKRSEKSAGLFEYVFTQIGYTPEELENTLQKISILGQTFLS